MRPEKTVEKVCHSLMLIILAFILIFTPLSFGAVNPAPAYITHIAILTMAALWIIKNMLVGKVKLLRTALIIPIVLFTAYAGLHVVFSDIVYYSRNEFIKIVDYALLFIIVLNNFYRKKYTYTIFFLIMTIALGLAAYGMIHYLKQVETVPGITMKHQLITEIDDNQQTGISSKEYKVDTFLTMGSQHKPEQYEHRASATFVCPNHLAGYLELVFPIMMALCLFSRLVIGLRMLIGYCLLIVLGGWVLTFSRGGWLAGVGSIIFFIILSHFREDTRNNNSAWLLPISVIVVTLALLAIFIKPIQDRVLTISPRGDNSTWTRVKIWRDTVEMVKEKPVFGFGAAGFLWHYPRYKHDKLNRMVTYTHNDYLNTLADYGFIGFGLVLLFFIILFARAKTIPQLFEFFDNQALVIGGLASMSGLLIHALFDFNSHIPSNALLFIIIAGFTVVGSCNLEHNYEGFWRLKWLNKSRILLLLVSFILLAITGWAIQNGIKLMRSEIKFRQGIFLQEQILWDEAQRKFEQAQQLDPYNPRVYAHLAEIHSAKNVFRKQNNDKPLEYYNLALQYNPYESDFMYKKALLLRRHGDIEGAYDLMQKALAQEPTNDAYEKHLRKLKKRLSN